MRLLYYTPWTLPVAIFALITATLTPAAAQNDRVDLDAAARRIIREANAFRQEHGLPPFTRNPELDDAAAYFADYMAETGEYGHQADGNTPAQRAQNYGYEYCLVMENIAYRFRSTGYETAELARKFHQGWVDSPGHRRNLLDPDATEIGVAIARAPDTGYYYAVQKIGRPQSQQIEFTLSNDSRQTIHYELGDDGFTLPPRFRRTHFACRPPTLVFREEDAPADEQDRDPIEVEPEDGDQFSIRFRNGRLRVERTQ